MQTAELGSFRENTLEQGKSPLEVTLSTMFPEKEQENKVRRARRVLGESVSKVTDEQLGSDLSNFEFIVNSWLDVFERNVFGGKTLKDLLKEIHAYEK